MNSIGNDVSEYTKSIVKERKPDEFIPTGIKWLDSMYGGKGLPARKLHQFVGNPGSFKSTLAANILGAFQRYYRSKNEVYHAYYLDTELSTSTARLTSLGVDCSQVKPMSIQTVEDVFKLIELIPDYKKNKIEMFEATIKDLRKTKNKENDALILENKQIIEKIENMNWLIIWDSLANTLTRKELDVKDEYDKVIGQKQKLLAKLLPIIIHKLEEYNVTLIVINQLRDDLKIDMFKQTAVDLKFLQGDKTIPGGTAMKFNSSSLLDLKIISYLREKDYGFDGLELEINAVKNKFFTPNKKIRFALKYQTGVSDFWTNFNNMTDYPAVVINTGERAVKLLSHTSVYKLHGYEKSFYRKNAEYLYTSDEDFKNAFDFCTNIMHENWIEENSPTSEDMRLQYESDANDKKMMEMENSNESLNGSFEDISENSNNSEDSNDDNNENVSAGGSFKV